MTTPIYRLFGLFVILFALLIVWTSRWTVFEATALQDNGLNKLNLAHQLLVKRGRILASDGTVLARSLPAKGGTWTRLYPTSSEFAQVVGYGIVLTGRYAGLESHYRHQIGGAPTGLASVFGPLSGNQLLGNDVYTSLDTKAQQVAIRDLAGRAGSVVALDPRTGEVLAMYANPSYDDNHITARCVPPACSQFNNSTQAGWPPGSTFKVVTAVAAIDSGKFKPSSVVNGSSPKTISGIPLSNDNNQSFGNIDLTTALTYSVNTVWAQVAQTVGRDTMNQYMQRFGVYSKPPLDYPAGEINPSQPYSTSTGRPLPPASPDEDLGRIGIGQGGLRVTPLQMAMVASAVANGGKLMAPHLVTRVVDPYGRTLETVGPNVYNQVMSASTAQQVTEMMRQVVKEGTGTAAALSGVDVAGKTGTATIGAPGSNLTQPWFIGFAPAGSPKVAVAVTIERTQGQFGGQVAAPIARDIIQTLLAEGK
ncbi:MAG TPA: penicillin-binding protein 2 [Solirubrobacteraceae bacterium]